MDLRRKANEVPLVRGVARYFWTLYRSHKIRQHLVESHYISLPPEERKRDMIRAWQRHSGCRVFVETGTYLGRTTLEMSSVFDRCYSIEIDDALFARAQQNLRGARNVRLLHGDSGSKLQEVLSELNETAVFWLDGHYSRGITGHADVATPIMNELSAIFRHPVRDHVILIDDARLFLGLDGYPTIRQLHRWVNAERAGTSFRIFSDVIHIYSGWNSFSEPSFDRVEEGVRRAVAHPDPGWVTEL